MTAHRTRKEYSVDLGQLETHRTQSVGEDGSQGTGGAKGCNAFVIAVLACIYKKVVCPSLVDMRKKDY